MDEKLLAILTERYLVANAPTVARLREWREKYPALGVPEHICDGLRALLDMPRTEKIDRAILWIVYALELVYEQVDREEDPT